MVADTNPQLRAEMSAALDVLLPQIHGMDDLIATPIEDDLRAVISTQRDRRERRQNLILAVIKGLDITGAAMTALIADGYPSLDTIAIPPNAAQELGRVMADIEAAAAVFKTDQAAHISIGLGDPVTKANKS